ncbi:orotidine-5'-phosphate decarboxylase [Exilibacterium tricleocarpae]|uniref:Orotidine 5'-phosphate decarboxylase n=1 Tax=Exilibacterium tricleocarpae TaxID=2591008 RepID=A0A545U445_9GAMM|nr:orotidine-5'-phosphate decarboxylase [Exilibacterium tricleocarpae]TQV84214.1 orotidine-5'-phosphate decarboxylase [Exilibacterium tricleocarpae]
MTSGTSQASKPAAGTGPRPSGGRTAGPRIIVALDYDNAADSLKLAERLNPSSCRLKVGKELFTSCGPQVVEQLIARGFDIFLDLKFHDIPNTVAKAVVAAADLGVWMLNVHAGGGERMMVAAREALAGRTGRVPLLIGVTVLTSMDAGDLAAVGVERAPAQQVQLLAQLTLKSGLDGVVCSALEAPVLRQSLGTDFCLVTPGIRPAGSAADDQRRVVTPADAIAAGSSYLVIGRPITQAEDPAEVCAGIEKSLGK